MVISALRVEIPTTAGAETPAQPDELEIAAAIAAVVAYTSATDNVCQSDLAPSDTALSSWKKAALREAAGGARVVAPQNHCKLSPWQAHLFFKVCLSLPIACLSVLLVTVNVLAQELRPLPVDQMYNETPAGTHYPPTAPAIRTTTTTATTTTTTATTTTQRRSVNSKVYSKVAPPQGYPFANGRSSSAPLPTVTSIPSVPFNGPLSSQPVTSSDGWIEDPPDDGSAQPIFPTSGASTNYGVPINFTSNMQARSAGRQTISPNYDPTVQAANQLNQAFMGKKTTIRIGLAFATGKIDIAAVDGAQIRDASSSSLVANLRPASRWDLTLVTAGRYSQIAITAKRQADSQLAADTTSGDRYKNVAFYPSTAPVNNLPGLRLPLRLLGADASTAQGDPATSSSGYIISPRSDDPNGLVAFNGKLYRGSIWLRPLPKLVAAGQYKAAAFDVINLVDVEDYLLSVVPSEMPSGWPLEALKAQAVAARSYAVANMGKHQRDGYDLRATIDDQVYSGIASESESSNLAVAETGGLVLKHDGKAITAFFHSTSGGSTEVSERVWGKSLPYLQSVPDFDDASPHFSWTKRIPADDLERMVGNDIGRLLSLSVVERTPSNRAQSVMAQGSNGSKLVTGEALRKSLKLPSTLFNVGFDGNAYIFAGRGYGHGLGMSQYGAKALAERGCNAAQILSYYYKDVVVDYAAPTPGI